MLSQSTTSRRIRKRILAICGWCGISYTRRADNHQRFCSQLCGTRHRASHMRGPNHPTYKGRVTHVGGYIRVWEPGHPLAMRDGYVLEHRLALHEAGVEIPAGCHVHHKNGNKADNRPENLEVLGAGAHHRHHIEVAGLAVNQFGTWPLHRQK